MNALGLGSRISDWRSQAKPEGFQGAGRHVRGGREERYEFEFQARGLSSHTNKCFFLRLLKQSVC